MKKRLAVICFLMVLMVSLASAQLSQQSSKIASQAATKVPDILGLKVPLVTELQNLLKKWNQPITVYQTSFNGDRLSVSLDPKFKGLNPLPPRAVISFMDTKNSVTISLTLASFGTPMSSVSSNFVWKFG